MEHQKTIKNLVEVLISSEIHSLIITGEPGFGKTTAVLEAVKGWPHRYVNNYATPFQFFKVLYSVQEMAYPKLLILDDIESTIRDKQIANMLKGALWEAGGKRIVSWHSRAVEVPEFEFTGKIIFILNVFDAKQAFWNAVADRSLYYRIQLSSEDKKKMLFEMAQKEFKDLSYNQRKKVLKFLMDNVPESELTLRTYRKALELYRATPNTYQALLRALFQKETKKQAIFERR